LELLCIVLDIYITVDGIAELRIKQFSNTGDMSKISPDEEIVLFDCSLGRTASGACIKIKDFDISPSGIPTDLWLQLPLNELRKQIFDSIEEYL
jgi:hypothetical protein